MNRVAVDAAPRIGIASAIVHRVGAAQLKGNLTAVTDPNGNVTTYGYDDLGRLLMQESPVTGATAYSYDEAGNLTLTTDANGATTSRTYDALGRVTAAVSTNSDETETVTWSYDESTANRFAVGRLSMMTDPTGSTGYAYERRGRLRSEERTIGS